jgi:hypothetical protein
MVSENVVASVSVECKKAAILEMERPRWFKFRRVWVVGFRGVPFLEDFTIEGGFQDAMGCQAGEKEDFATGLFDKGKAMSAGESGAPFLEQFSGGVIDKNVVCGMIGEKDHVSFPCNHDPVTVFNGRIGSEYAPAGDNPIPEIALAEDRRRGLRSNEGRGKCSGSLGFEELSAGDFHVLGEIWSSGSVVEKDR